MKISSILDLYSVKILLYLLQGEARYSELLKDIVSTKSTLSYTLADLIEENLINRIVIKSRPIQVKYVLTEKGYKVAQHFLQLKYILYE